jgi:hypothetical protein
VDRLLGGSEGLLLISTKPLSHACLGEIVGPGMFFLGGLTAILGLARITGPKSRWARHGAAATAAGARAQRQTR